MQGPERHCVQAGDVSRGLQKRLHLARVSGQLGSDPGGRGMPDESTTPDLVELVHRAFEAGGRRDIGALMSFYAPDAVCDMSPIGLGVYQNPRAIRGRGLP
jgi:hypothetical protein